MLAPPKRYGFPARVRCVPLRCTKGLARAKTARNRRTASWCRMGVAVTFLAAAAIGFSQHAGRLVVQAPAYRVVLSAQTGRVLEVDDARRRRLPGANHGRLWALTPDHRATR